jgi:hypothetical protein
VQGRSPNNASFQYILGEKSLVAVVIVFGRFQLSAFVVQMLSGRVELQASIFGA